VAYSLDLGHIRDNADLRVGKSLDYDTDCIGVGGDRKILLGAGVFYKVFVIEYANILADTLTDTLSLYRVISSIKKLILKRAGACVYNE
jgi:hypothetical protein